MIIPNIWENKRLMFQTTNQMGLSENRLSPIAISMDEHDFPYGPIAGGMLHFQTWPYFGGIQQEHDLWRQWNGIYERLASGKRLHSYETWSFIELI